MIDTHTYLHDLYDALHDSPMQRKIRTIAPMPFGVVFLPWKGMKEEEMREHFRTMKRLGFHNLKQTMPAPGWSTERILSVALEEDVIPFWYGEGGWEAITDELLEKLGIAKDAPIAEIRRDPRMIAHQKEVLRNRIAYGKISGGMVEGTVLQEAGFMKYAGDEIQLHNDPILREDAIPFFQEWCIEKYGTVERLVEEWNQEEVGIASKPYASWEDFKSDATLSRHNKREYGYLRDVLRFKADVTINKILKRNRLSAERDPEEPTRAGGEMGLFLPFAWRGTDMEGIAEAMKEYGSFYPSLHLAWHFEEVNYEVGPCVYMQASICVDWFKGGWSATWESTGGPQQFSGGKGWTVKSREETPGYTVNAGTMTQLLLSYLAAGFKGAGLWCWNYRRAGWEAGEYALLNRNNEPGERAIQAGRIAKAAEKHRDELWRSRKEPYVGVLVNWENECIWGAASVSNRDHFKNYPVHARIGATRSLIATNVPWEHVMPADIEAGLAPRYRVIFLPAQLSLPESLIEQLITFVENGGRVVLDAPGGWFDHKGRVLESHPGSPFERLFGACIDDFQYGNNVPYVLNGIERRDFIIEVKPTRAEVLQHFENGVPAVTEHRLGKGTAVILGWAASHPLYTPGQKALEEELSSLLLGTHTPPYSCEGAYVYRLASAEADHYFFINDGEAREVTLETRFGTYTAITDPVSGESLQSGNPIALEGYSGRWLRFAKEIGK
ncbi:MAG: beta-galactosidase trimerization domain-containing protein [Oceanipulchritudo sp.]